jgi:hypothetical protein
MSMQSEVTVNEQRKMCRGMTYVYYRQERWFLKPIPYFTLTGHELNGHGKGAILQWEKAPTAESSAASKRAPSASKQ